MLNKVESNYLTKRNIIGLEQVPRPDGGGIYTGATVSDVLEPIIVVDYVTLENYDLNGTETIDGVSPSNGSILLVANQTDASENGIYVYSTGGAWGRKTGLKGGYVISVKRGDTKAETLWIVQSDDFEEGTNDIDIIEYTFESKKPNILLNSNFDIWQRCASLLSTSTRARSSNVATLTTSYHHNYETGDTIQITNMNDSSYDEPSGVTITRVNANTFTYASTGTDESSTADTAGNVVLTDRKAMTVVDEEWTADRWLGLVNSGYLRVKNEDEGITLERSVTGYCGLIQIIPSKYFSGDTFSISLKAKASTGTPDIRIALLEWDSTVDNPTLDVVTTWGADPTLATNWSYAGKGDQVTMTTSFQTLSVENISVTGNNIAFAIFADGIGSTGEVQIKECQLIENLTIQDYQKPDIERELNECRKFYRKSYNLEDPPSKVTEVGTFKAPASFSISNGNTITTIQTERMYDTPTVTLYPYADPPLADDWTASTGTNVGVATSDVSQNSFVVDNDSGFSISTSHIGGHYICEVTII